jgi:hypothetical protein
MMTTNVERQTEAEFPLTLDELKEFVGLLKPDEQPTITESKAFGHNSNQSLCEVPGRENAR